MRQSVLRVTRDELQAMVLVPHIPCCSYYTGERGSCIRAGQSTASAADLGMFSTKNVRPNMLNMFGRPTKKGPHKRSGRFLVSSHLSGGSLVREFFFYRVRVRVRVSRVSRVSRVGRVSRV